MGPYVRLAAFLLAVVFYRQTFVTGRAEENLFNLWLYYALIVVGFWFVFGVSGQFAFSQAAFVGLGGYLSHWATREGAQFWVGFLAAGSGCALLATVFALLVRRTSHFAFAITTLGLSEILLLIFRRWVSFTGNVGGEIFGVRPISLLGRDLVGEASIFWVLLFAFAVAMLGAVLFSRSPACREAIAQRDQPVVAATLGLPVLRLRVTTFVLASVIAGLAGSLFVHWNGFATPGAFGLDLGLAIFLMLILGGLHSYWGPVLGAWFYTYVPHLLDLGQWRDVVYGALLVGTMVALPEGLIGIGGRLAQADALRRLTPRSQRRSARRGDVAPPVAAATPRSQTGLGDPLLEARDITVYFGGLAAVDGVDLVLARGEIMGVIGPNGSGKSTLLNALCGIVPARGTVRIDDVVVPLGRPGALRRHGVLRTFQTPQVYENLTCLENVLLTTVDRHWTGIVAGWLARPVVLRHEQERWRRATAALHEVGLLDLADSRASALAYGQRRMLELARAVAGEPRVLLLDEPSAGLNEAETEVLAAHLRALRERGVSLLVVDHKMDFVTSVCDRIAVLELGRVVAQGPWQEVLGDPRVIDAYLGAVEP